MSSYKTQISLSIIGTDDDELKEAISNEILNIEGEFPDAIAWDDEFGEEAQWEDVEKTFTTISLKYPDLLFVVKGLGEDRMDIWQHSYKAGHNAKWNFPDYQYPDPIDPTLLPECAHFATPSKGFITNTAIDLLSYEFAPFDAIEVHPCMTVDEHGSVEQCEPEEANFWSVYLHHVGGTCTCIADCTTQEVADGVAKLLEAIILRADKSAFTEAKLPVKDQGIINGFIGGYCNKCEKKTGTFQNNCTECGTYKD